MPFCAQSPCQVATPSMPAASADCSLGERCRRLENSISDPSCASDSATQCEEGCIASEPPAPSTSRRPKIRLPQLPDNVRKCFPIGRAYICVWKDINRRWNWQAEHSAVGQNGACRASNAAVESLSAQYDLHTRYGQCITETLTRSATSLGSPCIPFQMR